MGIDSYYLVGAADTKAVGMACLPWISHHFLSYVHLCEGKIDPSDRSGFGDLYGPVAASLKKWVAAAAAACEIVCTHATEFKWGLQVTAVPSAYSGKKLCTMYVLESHQERRALKFECTNPELELLL